jgi:hypothetical protein
MSGEIAAIRGVQAQLAKLGRNQTGVWLPTMIAGAMIKAADGQPKDGIGDLEAALEQLSRAQELHFFIGKIREDSGDLAGAMVSYTSVLDRRMLLGFNGIVWAARMRLAEVLIKSGKPAEAKPHGADSAVEGRRSRVRAAAAREGDVEEDMTFHP